MKSFISGVKTEIFEKRCIILCVLQCSQVIVVLLVLNICATADIKTILPTGPEVMCFNGTNHSHSY